MSINDQQTGLEIDVDKTNTRSHSLPDPSSEGHRGCGASKVHLRTIRELVAANSYHVPATLVAERMIDRAVREDHDPDN
ncbi:MAG: hypothetical protein ABH877_01590 [bacterium]